MDARRPLGDWKLVKRHGGQPGGSYRGIGIPDCVESGRVAASAVASAAGVGAVRSS